MILAISRFKVEEGFEDLTGDAFRQRPHLVEHAPGFLGMEVFTDHKDARIFYLVTRWTHLASFQQWHRSDAHRLSHAQIPRGLKLDRSVTKVFVLDRLDEPGQAAELRDMSTDSARLLADYLSDSDHAISVRAGHDGTIAFCNRALASLLKRSHDEVVGSSLWDHLTASDVSKLRDLLSERPKQPRWKISINLVTSSDVPVTVLCHIHVLPDGFIVIGERPSRDEHALQEQLLHLNNEAAVLNRELARKNKLLEQTQARLETALKELETSYWHLRKLQEVLPLCLACGKVKTAGAKWEDLASYLKQNHVLLSHSYCPACIASGSLSEW